MQAITNPQRPALAFRTPRSVAERTRVLPSGVPFGLLSLLFGLTFLPRIQVSPQLTWSIWSATAVLAVWLFILWQTSLRRGVKLSYEIKIVRAHYIQMLMHSSIYAYWGWYWHRVYHYIPLLIVQILFTYLFDMLLSWSKRKTWTVGFSVFPIVLSTNLFLWFRDEWYLLQFLMLSAAVLCKEWVRWKREKSDYRSHIFNPSGIALFCASCLLIASKTTAITWGESIANTLRRPPNIYIELFLLGLIVESLFFVTPVILSGAAVLYLLNFVYTSITGTYYFVDAGISVSLFLGLHFLITDPATSPKTITGKWIFGGLYGAGVFLTYGILVWLGLPQFYDKLLCVPFLNLSVRSIDRVGRSISGKMTVLMRGWNLSPIQTNVLHIAAWSLLFTAMMSTGFLSHRHQGARADFWEQACEKRAGRACTVWSYQLRIACENGSAASCLTWGTALELGQMLAKNRVVAGEALARSCESGLRAGCASLERFWNSGGEQALEARCYRGDPISCSTVAQVYASSAVGSPNAGRAMQFSATACSDGWAPDCYQVGQAYLMGRSFRRDIAQAASYLEKSCDGGYAMGCQILARLNINPVTVTQVERWRRRACFLGDERSCRAGENPN